MSLVEFLRARLDEDEQAARAASPSPWRDPDESSDLESLLLSREDAYHAYRWEPARVLAEVEAKRRLLRKHEPVTLQRRLGAGPAEDVLACGYDTDPDGVDWVPYPCETLKIIALPYADHPDYDKAWRP